MRTTRDGRIKIKYEELRVGMVLKWDDSCFYREDGKQFLLVTNIVYISESTWFVALRGHSANNFYIPDANRNPDPVHNNYWKHEHLTWSNLKQMHLIPQEILIGEAIQTGGDGQKEIYEKLKKKLKRRVNKIKEDR